MSTLILILNSDHVITSPSVNVVRNGRYNGSSTTLGFDTSEERALRVANEYKQDSYPDGEIVNLYHYRPTAKQLQDYIAALTEYYNAFEEHPNCNENAGEQIARCAEIKRSMAPATIPDTNGPG